MDDELRKLFLTNTDETGRMLVKSTRTGREYGVEPITPHKEHQVRKWGSIDPATGNLMNKKGAGKYTGAISEDESLITEANGFINIQVLEKGTSPLHAIKVMDDKYPSVE